MFPACGEGKLEDTPPEPEGLMLVVCVATRSLGKSLGGSLGGSLGKFFCTTVFLFENASLVDFQIRKRGHGGDLEENGSFL